MDDWKVKVSVLWLFPLVAFLASAILGVLEPGMIEQIIAGEVQGIELGMELLLVGAIIDVSGPLVMAFLSLTLQNPVNRWLNIIIGAVYAVLELITLVENLAQPKAYVILMLILAVVAPILIIWYAWKSEQAA